MGKQDKEFTWEEAEKLFPGSKASFIEWCSHLPEVFIFYWSYVSFSSTEINGIFARETSKHGKAALYLYHKGEWEQI